MDSSTFQTTSMMHHLPNELLVHIFSHLTFADAVTAGRVCRRWRNNAEWALRNLSLANDRKDSIVIGGSAKWNLRFVQKYLANGIRTISFKVGGGRGQGRYRFPTPVHKSISSHLNSI